MPNTIDASFITQYDTDLHMAYQQYGSKLHDFVRVKNGVKGSTVTFQKYGTGTAVSKTRNGDITPMNPAHTTAIATLTDWYAGEYVDKLDEYKNNIDERKAILMTGAGALGRKCDDLIIAAANTTTNLIDRSTLVFSLDTLMAGIENLLGNEVFDGPEGQVTVVLGLNQWTKLLTLKEFASSDYRRAAGMFGDQKVNGVKQFLGMNFVMSNRLAKAGNPATGTTASTETTDCLIFDKKAIGLGEAKGTETDIDWVGPKAAHWVNSMLSAGACLIDPIGVGKLRLKNI